MKYFRIEKCVKTNEVNEVLNMATILMIKMLKDAKYLPQIDFDCL